GFSAHADQRGLVSFAEQTRRQGPLQQIFLVHGEVPAQTALAGQLAAAGFTRVVAPAPGERARLVP
ncbi:MAG TPA: MBL fold metallo-hydrolase RNA specificity domain-containing protein, partial [Kofleriaceae bacterium]|nr:MBL fold metallo-hydrolase RNA specificity domain-containing protein [Kofleriaceae bacterium]